MHCVTFESGIMEQGLIAALGRTLSVSNPHRLPSTVAREDEHVLVAAAKAGDVRAFEELVERYERKIFRLTMNITRNREDAEDAMQDAFLKSYSHLKEFEGTSRFYTWLVRIAANEALMRLRKRARTAPGNKQGSRGRHAPARKIMPAPVRRAVGGRISDVRATSSKAMARSTRLTCEAGRSGCHGETQRYQTIHRGAHTCLPLRSRCRELPALLRPDRCAFPP